MIWNRFGPGRRRSAVAVLAAAALAVGLWSAPPASAASAHHEADRLATAFGANLRHTLYVGGERTALGTNTAAFRKFSVGSDAAGAERGGLNQLATLIQAFAGHDPRTHGGYLAIQSELAAIDRNAHDIDPTWHGPAVDGYKAAGQALDRMQRVYYTNGHDELRRKLHGPFRNTVRAVILTAAVSGGALLTLAINNVALSTLQKAGIGVTLAVLIAAALVVFTTLEAVSLDRQSAAFRQDVRAIGQFITRGIVAVTQLATGLQNLNRDVARLRRELNDLRHDVAQDEMELGTYTRHGVFRGQPWAR